MLTNVMAKARTWLRQATCRHRELAHSFDFDFDTDPPVLDGYTYCKRCNKVWNVTSGMLSRKEPLDGKHFTKG